MPPKRPRHSSISLPVERPKTTHPTRVPSTPLPRPAPFPASGATAYTSVSGPIKALTLGVLTALRVLPDYESCNPALADAQLSRDWDFSRKAVPRARHEPLRVPQVDIDGEWDKYKLQALVKGSREDIEVLNELLVEVEREVHDADREISDARKKGWAVEAIDFWAPQINGYNKWRRLQVSTDKYEVEADWELDALQAVFSEAQRNVDRLLHTLHALEEEAKDKRRLIKSLERQFGEATAWRGYRERDLCHY